MPLSESFEKKERKLALIVILKHLLSGGIAHWCPDDNMLFYLLRRILIKEEIMRLFNTLTNRKKNLNRFVMEK